MSSSTTVSKLIIEPNTDLVDWSVEADLKAKSYPFPLDNFQKRAVRAINNSTNVFCLAMTGSGKTLLADYAIAYALMNGKRAIFTSPIKALSNQKYKEFKDTYGENNVGILTGDIKFNPDGRVLIMTAEILRNLLYKQSSYTKDVGITSTLSLCDVATVIMDEIHYINNVDRGHVWEETLVMLPKEINLVLLSATIDHPERLGKWLADVRQRDIHMLSNTVRVVPLTHYLYKPTFYSDLADPKLRDGALITLMTNDGKYSGDKVYREWTKEYNRMLDNTLPKESDEYKQQAEKTFTGQNRLNNLIEYLKYCQLCPAICFVFSRKNCYTYAKSIQDSLITGKDACEIEHIFNFYTHRYKETLQYLPQYYNILDLLKKGVAYHHSGLVPILKEVIEIIFSKGYIKVLFATETFSVGLNMPTKTVVFLEYRKPDNNDAGGNRMLLTDEYLQMAGRAGRRGKDTRGYVIYCPMRQPEEHSLVKNMMTGRKEPVKSHMEFGFEFILKSLNSNIYNWSDIVKNSFWYEEQLESNRRTLQKIEEVKQNIKKITLSERETQDLEERNRLEISLKNDKHIDIKQRQRALDSWKNTHIGKRWDDLYAKWRELDQLQKQLSNYVEDAEQFGDLNGFISSYAHYLNEIGYLTDTSDLADFCQLNASHLTTKGIVATEFNEGHAILSTEFYDYIRENLEKYSQEDIICSLSLFMQGDRLKTSQKEPTTLCNEATKFLEETATQLCSLAEKKYQIYMAEDYWTINKDWYYIVMDWLNGNPVSDIMTKYEIMEGNLIRGILKLSNLLEEWRNVATYKNDVAMLERLSGIETILIRDVVIPDSLYIRI